MLKDLLRYKVKANRVGVVMLLLFFAVLVVAIMINRSFTLTFWDRGYQVKADFTDADGIANASDVRLAGVYVGQVTNIVAKPGGVAEITFRVDKQHAPLREGTSVDLRLQTLLGAKFLELRPGNARGAALQADTVIPVVRTTSPVDFDQFLSVFDQPTRESVATILQQGAAATAGKGEAINGLLTDLHDLSVASGPDLQTFADRGSHLDGILTDLADVGSNLAQERQHLANLQTNLNSVLGTIADNDPAFRRLITEGDASLGHGLAQYQGEHQNIGSTINNLRGTLDTINPLLVDVTTYSHALDQILRTDKTLTPDIGSANSEYNHNPANTSCGSVGCGGFYLRQFAVLAVPPVDTEKAGAAAAAGTGRLGTSDPNLILGLPGGTIPGTTIPATPVPNSLPLPLPLPTPGAPLGYSSRSDAELALLNFLLGA
ncbi:MAG: MlaD family protein [Candidatus Dormibacteria bacterium]